MDNFKRYRRPSGRSFATDGFINQPRHRRTRDAAGSADLRSRMGEADNRPKIGNFRTTDGLHARNQLSRPSKHNTHEQPRPRRSPQARMPRGEQSESINTVNQKEGIIRRLNPFRPTNWTKRKAAAALAITLIMAGSFFGGKAWFKFQQIFSGGGGAVALSENVDPTELKGEGDGRINMLLLGRGGNGHEGADLTDTIIIASINLLHKEAALLSIPRDLYVSSDGLSYSKINAVFAFAKEKALASSSNPQSKQEIRHAEEVGFKAAEDMIEAKIGIPIHYHGMIDFDGFRKAVDTIGGVDLNVSDTGTVYDPLRLYGRQYILNVKKGQQHFDGLRALAYARSRYTSTRGDFDRAERQRMLLSAIKTKVLSASTYSNPLKISQLMDDFGNHIRTNLSIDEVMRLYDLAGDFGNDDVASVGLADPPNEYVTTDYINGQSVVVPRAGLDDYSEIQHFVRNRLRDSFLAEEDAKVAILNGTAIPGLAGRTAENLESFGYTISKVSNAPVQGYHTTMLVDLSGGSKKYTSRYLENRFTTESRDTLPDPMIDAGNADFVIIIGQNEQIRLSNQ